MIEELPVVPLRPTCARPGCSERATTRLVIAQLSARLLHVDDHSAPFGAVPLCDRHAERVAVPDGWTLSDERPRPEPMAAPGSPLMSRAFRSAGINEG